MKLRTLLKTSLMLGLIIAGRFARDVERANPGRSLNQIIDAQDSVRATAQRTPAMPVIPASNQTASLQPMMHFN
jgi:hypothetical protein